MKDSKYFRKDKLHYKEQLVDQKQQLVDNDESITPTTDKGYFSFTKALEKLSTAIPENEDLIDETHEESDISKEEIALVQNRHKHSDNIFIKKYEYEAYQTGNSKVLRFGINTKNIDKKVLLKYNSDLRLNLKKVNKHLDKMSNISKESNYKKFIEAVPPTHIENSIVKNAIDYLTTTGSKTVLVDVFPRVLNSKVENAPVGTIKSLETHTALLYYNGKDILVIDPNNPQFSAFLENVDPKIKSSYRADDKIYTRHGDASPDSWRDYIDIAVKLAFVLNSSKEIYQDIESITKSSDIKSLSNNDFYDKNIFYNNLFDKDYDKYELHSKNHHIRNKQTSNLEDVNSFKVIY